MRIHEVLSPLPTAPALGLFTRKQLVYPLRFQSSSKLLPFLCSYSLPWLSQSPPWPSVAQSRQTSELRVQLWEFSACRDLSPHPLKYSPAFQGAGAGCTVGRGETVPICSPTANGQQPQLLISSHKGYRSDNPTFHSWKEERQHSGIQGRGGEQAATAAFQPLSECTVCLPQDAGQWAHRG